MTVVIQASQHVQIPIDAVVSCSDGLCGKSTRVLVNPVTGKVTHLVVKQIVFPHEVYVVPVHQVAGSSVDTIVLKCTKDELKHFDRFVRTEYINELVPPYVAGYPQGTYLVWPYVVPTSRAWIPAKREQIPPGELAVRRGTRVESTEGFVGYVESFLVNPDTSNVTHLVVCAGHLLAQKEVSIPISVINTATDEVVTLKLTTQEFETLPSIPNRRPPLPLS